MEDDRQRYEKETSEEAHYWFTMSDAVALSLEHGLEKVLKDMLQLREQYLKKGHG
jgi:hypothetical protein